MYYLIFYLINLIMNIFKGKQNGLNNPNLEIVQETRFNKKESKCKLHFSKPEPSHASTIGKFTSAFLIIYFY